MSQSYIIVGRKNPQNPEAPKKFYAQSRSMKKVTVKEICKRVSERSSYSRGELEGAIGEFLIEIQNVLEEGNIAQMGDLGNFRLIVRNRGAAITADDYNTSLISGSRVSFYAGTELRDLCKRMKYALYKKDEVKVSDEKSAA